MNILFLALEPPYPPNDGGRIRTYNLLKHVTSQHRVTLATFADAVQDAARLAAVRELCAEVLAVRRPESLRRSWLDKLRDLPTRDPIGLRQFHSYEMAAAIRRLVGSAQYGVAHIDQIYLAQYLPLLEGLATVVDHVDVEAIAQQRMLRASPDRYQPRWLLAWLEYWRWRRFELWATRRCDVSTVVSERDAAYFRQRIPGVPVFVVPSGVDTDFFRPTHEPADAATLLYTGKMSYPPNADAVTWFCTAILPLIRQRYPDVQFLIVGRDPPPAVQALASLPGVTVTGEVADVRPYYARTTVYVVPLRSGGGTRLKIPEAMAMGMPIVSTSLGCEGLRVVPGEDILVADEPLGFAQHVLRLLDDAQLRLRLERAARQSAEAHFTWPASAVAQAEAYSTAVARHARRAGTPAGA